MISHERLAGFKATLEEEVEFDSSVTEELLIIAEFLGPVLLARVFLTQREWIDNHCLDAADENGPSLHILAYLLSGYLDNFDFDDCFELDD